GLTRGRYQEVATKAGPPYTGAGLRVALSARPDLSPHSRRHHDLLRGGLWDREVLAELVVPLQRALPVVAPQEPGGAWRANRGVSYANLALVLIDCAAQSLVVSLALFTVAHGRSSGGG